MFNSFVKKRNLYTFNFQMYISFLHFERTILRQSAKIQWMTLHADIF